MTLQKVTLLQLITHFPRLTLWLHTNCWNDRGLGRTASLKCGSLRGRGGVGVWMSLICISKPVVLHFEKKAISLLVFDYCTCPSLCNCCNFNPRAILLVRFSPQQGLRSENAEWFVNKKKYFFEVQPLTAAKVCLEWPWWATWWSVDRNYAEKFICMLLTHNKDLPVLSRLFHKILYKTLKI